MEVKRERLLECIEMFQNCQLLVVGDIMLDHYIWGSVDRISPEAPVPVVNVNKESMQLGGASNVLNNIFSLGAKGDLCGIVGNDSFAEKMYELVKSLGIDPAGLIVDENRQTIKKTRIIANSQHVVRFDREDVNFIDTVAEAKLLEKILAKLPDCDSLIISDYAKGVVTENIMKRLVNESKRFNKPIIVDPKVKHFGFYRGVTLATPNALEASAASGIKIEPKGGETLLKAGALIKKELDCNGLLITRGAEGMTLFENDGVIHIPTRAKKVYDVTGAGDTVTAVLGLCMGIGASLLESAILANYAAGMVVEVVGTATAGVDGLKKIVAEEFDSGMDYKLMQ